ncbi:hypothetical protein BGZ79_009144 [Entomortierella chlamydospora]|nr:hypothetical protein BGZ79_009144 [Entomortierella chlamydospora]
MSHRSAQSHQPWLPWPEQDLTDEDSSLKPNSTLDCSSGDYNLSDVSDHEFAFSEKISPHNSSVAEDCASNRQSHAPSHEYSVYLQSVAEKTEEFDGDYDDENVGLLPNSQQRLNNTGRSLGHILHVVNILAFILIVLFCIAVLNIYTEPARSKSSPCLTSAATPVRMGQSMQEEVSRPSSIFAPPETISSHPVFDSGSSGEIDTLRHPGLKHRDPPKLPPKAKRIPRPLTLYNETLIDNYHWMHQIQHDPDVMAYIEAESKYTSSWIEQSGVAALQKQLEKEISQIKGAMDSQESIYQAASDEHSTDKPHIRRLEGTQFWDVDRWRYWLDDSVGSYGVYMRRSVSKDVNDLATFEERRQYTSSQVFEYSDRHQVTFIPPPDQDALMGNPVKFVGGCPAEPSPTLKVQQVLDINRIAKKQEHKGSPGEFSFGSIEIQPLHTLLDQDVLSNSEIVGASVEPRNKDIYAAYTLDTTGDEQYQIHITVLSSDYQELDTEQLANHVPGNGHLPPHMRHNLEIEDQAIEIDGSTVKDAGPETRFVRVGRSLYLYFTRLDGKGLSREIWRVKIESLDDKDLNSEDVRKQGEKNTNRHELVKDNKPKYEPEMILRETDELNVLTISETSDRRFLLAESTGQTNSHTYFFSIDYPDKGWNIVRQPEEDVVYKVEHHSGYFYLRTNHGNATNFKVIRFPVKYAIEDTNTPIATPSKLKFPSGPGMKQATFGDAMEEVVIACDPEDFLERFEVFVEHLVAWVWRGGLQEIRIFLAPRPGNTSPKFPLVEAQRIRPYNSESKVATVMPGNIRHGGQRLFRDFYSTRGGDEERQRNATRLICQDSFPVGVKYGQPIQPALKQEVQQGSTLREDSIKDPKKEQEKEIAKFKEIRIMVPSKHHSERNGTMQPNTVDQEILIPVSVVYYKFQDGHQFPRRAAFVSAYGAYGSMTSPKYTPEEILPLLYRGLLFVEIHPRGDGILGPDWYTDGKAEHKMNTFYDVEDVLLYLRDSGMVEKEGCVIQGRSAGGLVSGWISNRWGEAVTPPPGGEIGDPPENGSLNIVREMVKVVLAQVPFVDVIADMSDPDIPWVEYEWAEWGSPLQSREIFEVMKAYSPYDRIRNQPYPPMMIMGGLTDSRVSYAEPLKFVTKLRSIDGKTNDCQPVEREDDGDDEGDSYKNRSKKMCAGKNETPLLLQIEKGGHFSGKKSLWMAFALYNLGIEEVERQ